MTLYVAYLTAGSVAADESSREVDGRDPRRAARNAPARAFGFYFFERATAVVEVGGTSVGLASEPYNLSKTFYINADLLDAEQVAGLAGNHEILLDNMETNGWSHVVRTRTGEVYPYDEERHELVSIR